MSYQKIVDFLIPPKHVPNEEAGMWIRRLMLIIFMLGFGMIAHMAVSYGWMGTDFARASESDIRDLKDRMGTLETSMTGMSSRILIKEVRELKVMHCEARRDENDLAARYINDLITGARLQYAALEVGRNTLPIPSCRQLGIEHEGDSA